MGKVLDWADVQGVDLDQQRLSSTLPKVRKARKSRYRRGGGAMVGVLAVFCRCGSRTGAVARCIS